MILLASLTTAPMHFMDIAKKVDICILLFFIYQLLILRFRCKQMYFLAKRLPSYVLKQHPHPWNNFVLWQFKHEKQPIFCYIAIGEKIDVAFLVKQIVPVWQRDLYLFNTNEIYDNTHKSTENIADPVCGPPNA